MRFFDTRLGRCATLLALSGAAAALYAQGTQTASATVTVVDKSGAPVANARVRLTSPSMMSERVGATNSAGIFVARLLPPGTYTIEVIRDGFQTARNVRAIGMDQHYQPRLTLETVAGATVEVVAAASSAIDPTDVKTATNWNPARVYTLPSGRTPDAMAQLSPGVTTGVGGRTQIRGAMTSGNLYLVDGQNLMDNTYNNLQYRINSDAIEEAQVITGAISAEYGSVDGGVVNTLTKSGGNEFTGLVRLNLSNPQWDAVQPHQDRSEIANILSESWTYNIGGYIIKDKLWFYVSFFSQHYAEPSTIAADAAMHPDGYTGVRYGAGAGYTYSEYDIRRQFKLTYLVNQDHYVVATYNNTDSGSPTRDYSSGDLNAIVPQDNEFQFWNLAWRATWSPQFTTEVRFGAKESNYRAGGMAGEGAVPPIYSYYDEYFYRNGIFNYADGGDKRQNQTGNIKGSFFTEWHGSHELDFGFDYYKGTRTARNEQSPYVDEMGFNRIHGVDDYYYDDEPGPTFGQPLALGSDVWNMFATPGSASQTQLGLYINDKWKLNNNLALMVGLRWDSYSASADDVGSTSSASGISPRLGATYDLLGDQTYIFKASYCRYNGAVMETITSAVSGVGNPGSLEWAYLGPGTGWWDPDEAYYVPLSQIYNMDNYRNPDGSHEVSWFDDPARTTKLDSGLKAPTCDEIQLSATYSFDFEKWGKGFASLTFVKKDWKNLVDYRMGYDGYSMIDPGDYTPDAVGDEEIKVYYRTWGNEPDAKREYEGLELQVAYELGKLNVTGGITWSSLKGNYEGEAANTPGSGSGIHNMDRFTDNNGNWTDVYDYNLVRPYGYLAGHRPIVMRWQADYTVDSAAGTTVVGFAYRFTSGAHYSHARTAYAWSLNRNVFGDLYSPESLALGQVWTQYENNEMRNHVFNASAYHDLAITHNFNVAKVAGYQISAFAKVSVYNLFNHQQLVSWNTQMNRYTGTNADTEFVQHGNYGRTDDPQYWGAARSYGISAGIRF
jgi:hypothetical protein